MSKKRILLIDDEPDFTNLLKLFLEKTGDYDVKEENRGEHALAAARAFRPDLILLDVMMPDTDGGQVAARLMADAKLKDTPVVFLTAVVAEEEAKRRQGRIGGRPFIAKPAGPEEILSSIEEHLPKSTGSAPPHVREG
jgi:DNA-binding response OmpR family regulator